MTLDELEPGGRGTILSLDGTGPLLQRIMQLGLLEGTEVEVLRRAPTGDPIEVRVLDYSLSLRRDEARRINIAPAP